MGSDSEHKNEIDPAVFGKAIYVADSLIQTRRLGGARTMRSRPGTASAPIQRFAELGQVIAGTKRAGWRAPASVTSRFAT